MPVVAAELQRVRQGFEGVAEEAVLARAALLDVETRQIGTAACDAAVESGVRDLELVLARLEAVAADCVRALGRYDGSESDQDPA